MGGTPSLIPPIPLCLIIQFVLGCILWALLVFIIEGLIAVARAITEPFKNGYWDKVIAQQKEEERQIEWARRTGKGDRK